jgi:hypothetical protein
LRAPVLQGEEAHQDDARQDHHCTCSFLFLQQIRSDG